MRFDTSGAPRGVPDEGAYGAECVHAEEKVSKAGDPYMSLKLKLDGIGYHVYDVLMCAGKGAGMGKKKAEAFGVDTDGELGPEDFEGKRVTVHCVHESYQGKRKLAVDSEQGEYLGYDAADDFPAAGEKIPF